MAMVLDALVSAVMEKLVDAGIKKNASILGVNSELQVLQRNMMSIRRVLVDAESKKIEGKAIALWFAELREVLYDAEDLLDDFADAQLGKSKSGMDIILFIPGLSQINEACEKKISTKIENINSTLERLTSPTLQLLVSQPNADRELGRYNGSRITGTCSFQLDYEIVGIDDDATDLVDRITGDSNRAHSLFAITGMAGSGKTTLAQKVFDHRLIKKHFDNNVVWVCVSSNRSSEELLKEIIRPIEKDYRESCVTLNELSSKLVEVVKEKRVFIVLDDIWDSRVWEKFLRVPLSKAEKHSRILITTRNQQVAMKMNAAHTHLMTNMLQSDGWSMLCKIVFEEEDKGDLNELEKVGKEIVDRCKGLPLAINVVGGVLRETDRTIAAWTRVLSSTTWSMQDLPEDILASLLLSYEDLPSHLKRCFIYCSLFPQDFNFHPTKLMYMWIAEGFIHKKEGTRMEESAKEYYNELVMRNLLQVSLYRDGSCTCKMHDLLHSLAIFVSQNQYIYVDPKTFGSSDLFRHRHLRFNVENMNVDPKEIIGQDYVRTLMFSTDTEIEEIPDELLSGLRRLRVLDLEGIIIKRLPDSVGNMRQLRFLCISSSKFTRLPDSIEELKHLETLIVSLLESRSLPQGIGKLDNLRHLLVSDTLLNMPNGLDNLKKLRVLDCFVVNECTSSSTSRRGVPLKLLVRKKSEDCKPNMKELKDLSQLTDLSVYHLERVASKKDAEEAAIAKKTSLKCLKLHCELPPLISYEDIKKIEEVFAGIAIPENLTELSIYGFFGKQLPDHMGWSRLHQVKSFKLERCKLLEQLPSLGDMPKLETLHITNLSVVNFGPNFVGESKFPKLQDFHLMEMEELVNMFDVEIGDFPCLVNLHISGCPKLESLGEGLQHAPCLKKMTVRDLDELESIENYSSISELEISWNPSLISVKNLPSLKKLDINYCSALGVVQDVPKLSSLSISSDAEMTTPPEWLKNTIASEKWHWTVTGSEELVLMSRSKRVEVKINGVKVDKNFPGASVNDFMDVDNSSIMDGITDKPTKNFTEEISSTSSSIPSPVLQPKTSSSHSVDRERTVFSAMDMVLDGLVSAVMEKLVDAGIKKNESEMEAFQRNIVSIRCVLDDVKSKKIESKVIALWLAELREVLYDAEDLLDDFAATQRRKSGKEAIEKSKISTIIQNINSTLERLTSPILQLMASQPNADRELGRYNGSRITDTSSFQLDSEIVGIDDDATHLVDRIIRDRDRAHSLFAITGMGGSGKSTLARKVFNHDLIQKHFQNKVWVCISSNCTGEYLLKKIVRSIDKNYSESRDSLDELSSEVIEVLKEKRVFIVLDDIWDSHVWEKFLRVPLYAATKHSRILITTRNQQIAMKMKIGHTHRMPEMNLSDGWSMLCKIVFEEEDNGVRYELEKVGKEIVDRCKGLPFAINVVGGVLRMTDRTIAAWTRVLSSTTWSMQDLPEDILASLLLSYEDLPSHLKRCFIYCSLFPRDFSFHPTKLMYMWIAEGFIQKEEGTRMEESAKEYYNELVMRNLLQVSLYIDGSCTCKIHDLLHSLATFVSQNQYIYVDPKTFIGSSGLIRHRHLRFNVENMNVDPKEIRGKEHVRTLMLSTNTEDIPDKFLSGLKRLRVLDLEGIKIERLPEDSVGNMRQLRFLSISSTELHMLPDSIENLENLETLIIASFLKSRSLPKGIGKLRNLRHLLVRQRLQNMPNGLDNLTRLRVLDCFVVNECTSRRGVPLKLLVRKKSEDCKPNMKELKDLSQLTHLSISNLERVASKEEAQEAAIEMKTSLESLTLGCDLDQRRSTSDEDIQKIEEVFAGIKLPENLKYLRIYGFFGKQLPDHMTLDRLRQLTSLKLANCTSLTRLPSLGDMPELQRLEIWYAESVVELGSEFLGSLKFPKLQKLELWGMQNLERMFDVERGAFPCLVELFISGCPKLNSLGEGWNHATCLETLEVTDVKNLKSIENLTSISILSISQSRLKYVKNLPSLKRMIIHECPALEDVNEVGELDSLDIIDFHMTTLPRWLESITPPKKLSVNGSEELVLGIEESVEAQNIIKKCLHAEVRSVFNGSKYISYRKDHLRYNSNSTGCSGASSSSVTIT